MSRGPSRRRGPRRRSTGGRLRWLLLAALVAGGAVAAWLLLERPAERPRLAELLAPRPSVEGEPSPSPPPTDEPRAPAERASPPPSTAMPAERSGPLGHLALVIDDLGRSLEEIDQLDALGVPLSFSVLPYESRTGPVAALLGERGREVLVHLPMEGNGSDPGPGALTGAMSRGELAEATRSALARVPGAVGVNNHMGSELTRDPEAMRAVLAVLAAERLFFVDSRTSAESAGFTVAREMGLPTAERQVFLDDADDPEAIRGEFARLRQLALERGAAIAIAHPRPSTLAVLREEIPRALADGFVFVPASFLLERPGMPLE